MLLLTAMNLVVFGLTVSSSWGNGHATLWRGLLRALATLGHRVTFFERDVPYYAAARDLMSGDGYQIRLYPDWTAVQAEVRATLAEADVAIVTSYCPDALEAAAMIAASDALSVFYDLDAPVTLERWSAEGRVPYIGREGLLRYDLVLSYTGGRALDQLREQLGEREVAPLYGSVDASVHGPAAPHEPFRSDCSYLGTYAADRQATLERLFLGAAAMMPARRFLIGGAQYPHEFPWAENIAFVYHLPPADHGSFYCSSRVTLNVTRRAMAAMGWCPSGRLFEAAACGVPIVTDWWEGLDRFFTPIDEVLIAHDASDVVCAIELSDAELASIGERARERALRDHSALRRAEELVDLLTAARADTSVTGGVGHGAAVGGTTER